MDDEHAGSGLPNAETDVELSVVTEPVDLSLRDAFGVDEDDLLRVVVLTLGRVGITESVEVSLLVTDDAGLRRLNREYRGRDEATDVLSFPLSDTPLVEAPAEQLWQPGDDAQQQQRSTLDGLAEGTTPHAVGHVGHAGDVYTLDDVLDVRDVRDVTGEDGDDALFGDDDDADLDLDSWEDDAETTIAGDEMPLHLGDIALSRDAVQRQASAAKHSAAWECAYLVAHGVLHLVGYDDQTQAGYDAMVMHQEAVLAEADIVR